MKFKTLVLTTALIIGIAGTAYAWTLTGTSTISTSTLSVSGTSKTSADVICESMYVDCAIYRDGKNINFSTNEAAGVKAVSASTSGSNLPGEQFWEIEGIHTAEYTSGNSKVKTSRRTTLY